MEVGGPVRTRPMWDQCHVGGLNHPYCGLGTVQLTLSGFDAYGGVPACDDPAGCRDDDLAVLREGTPGTRVDVLVRCTGEWFPRVASVPLRVGGGPFPSAVGPASRVDSDTARVGAVFSLPSPADIGVCGPDATNLYAAVVRGITVGFDGVADGVPSWTSRVRGLHPVDLAR